MDHPEAPANQVTPTSLAAFRSHLPEIANLVRDKLLLDMGEANKSALANNPSLFEDTIAYFGELLQAVYSLAIPRALAHEYAGLSYTLGKRGFDAAFFHTFLEAWIIAINSTITASAAQELTLHLTWLHGYFPRLSAASCPVFDPLSPEQNTFLELLLARERQKAREYLLGLVKLARSPLQVIEEVLVPAMCRVGLLWQEGSITVADEHAATNICRYISYYLLDLIPPKKHRNLSAFLCCVPGEEHDLALEILAGLLERNGWRISFIGHNTPQGDLVAAVKKENPRVVFLSVTLVTHLPAARALMVELMQQKVESRFVLGGFGVLFAKDSFPQATVIANQISEGFMFARELEKEHA